MVVTLIPPNPIDDIESSRSSGTGLGVRLGLDHIGGVDTRMFVETVGIIVARSVGVTLGWLRYRLNKRSLSQRERTKENRTLE